MSPLGFQSSTSPGLPGLVDVIVGQVSDEESDLCVVVEAIATLETMPFWSQEVDGFDFFIPDLNVPASELDRSAVSNLKNHPSHLWILLGDGSVPDPDVDGDNQVSPLMDMFSQRMKLSGRDPESNFGVIEDVSMNNMEMGLSDQQLDFDPNVVDGYFGNFCANYGDEFIDSLRGSVTFSEPSDSLDWVEHDLFMGDMDIESDSRVMDDFTLCDDNVNDFAFGDEEIMPENLDHVNNNHDFDWEDIGGSVNDIDALSMFIQGEAEDDASVVPGSRQFIARETNETMGNLEWEVLLNTHSLEVNHGLFLQFVTKDRETLRVWETDVTSVLKTRMAGLYTEVLDTEGYWLLSRQKWELTLMPILGNAATELIAAKFCYDNRIKLSEETKWFKTGLGEVFRTARGVQIEPLGREDIQQRVVAIVIGMVNSLAINDQEGDGDPIRARAPFWPLVMLSRIVETTRVMLAEDLSEFIKLTGARWAINGSTEMNCVVGGHTGLENDRVRGSRKGKLMFTMQILFGFTMCTFDDSFGCGFF